MTTINSIRTGAAAAPDKTPARVYALPVVLRGSSAPPTDAGTTGTW